METTKEERTDWILRIADASGDDSGFLARLLRDVDTLLPVVEWAARGPCLCHPANKANGMECLKDAADAALKLKEETNGRPS